MNQLLIEQYDGLAEFIQKFSRAVLVLKKEYVLSDMNLSKQYPHLNVSESERRRTHELGEGMINYLQENSSLRQSFPPKIKLQELDKIKLKILNEKVLDEEELKQLDIILFSLDEERSVLFRKLSMNRV